MARKYRQAEEQSKLVAPAPGFHDWIVIRKQPQKGLQTAVIIKEVEQCHTAYEAWRLAESKIGGPAFHQTIVRYLNDYMTELKTLGRELEPWMFEKLGEKDVGSEARKVPVGRSGNNGAGTPQGSNP